MITVKDKMCNLEGNVEPNTEDMKHKKEKFRNQEHVFKIYIVCLIGVPD